MKKLFFLSLVFVWGCSTTSQKSLYRHPASVAKASVVQDSENAAHCFMAVIKGDDAGDPTYQHLLGLIKFKPQARLAVGNYLNLPGGQDPVSYLQTLMAGDSRGAAGQPPYATTDKTCTAVRPLAAELNLMFESGSMFAREDVAKDLNELCARQPEIPKCVRLIEAARERERKERTFPDECWGRNDLQKCKEEVQARQKDLAPAAPVSNTGQ